jgi:hypothetical protein
MSSGNRGDARSRSFWTKAEQEFYFRLFKGLKQRGSPNCVNKTKRIEQENYIQTTSQCWEGLAGETFSK